MKHSIKFIKLILLLALSIPAMGDEYRAIGVVETAIDPSARVHSVSVLESHISTEEELPWIHRQLDLTLGIHALKHPCTSITRLRKLPPQASFETNLFESEIAYRLETESLYSTCMGASMSEEHVKVVLTFRIDHRWDMDPPFPPLQLSEPEATRFLSFYVGDKKDRSVWALYKLDFRNIEEPKLDFVKHYNFVQGEPLTR